MNQTHHEPRFTPVSNGPEPGQSRDLPLSEVGLRQVAGRLNSTHDQAAVRALLNDLPAVLSQPDSQLLYRQRNRVYRVPFPGDPDAPGLCIKVFRRPGLLRSLVYRRQGSKAARAYRYAAHLRRHGSAVAEPVAYLERWRGGCLRDSYLITYFLPDASDLYTELTYVLRQNPDLDAVLSLLRVAARAIRDMHDHGFLHGDLGPQNLLLNRVGPAAWANPTFIDMNRGRLRQNPNWQERARDFQRMKLPSHLLQHFLVLYCHDQEPPRALVRGVRKYQRRFRRHQRTRRWRHPLQTLRRRLGRATPARKVSLGQPPESELWLWDNRAAQPAATLTRPGQKRYRQRTDALERLIWRMRSWPMRYRRERRLAQAADQKPLAMNGRLGVTLDTTDRVARQLQQVARLPGIPLRVPVYFHLGQVHWQALGPLVTRLIERGHPVTVLAVHSRTLVRQPADWRAWLQYVQQSLPDDCPLEIMPHPEQAEYGIWTRAELETMLAARASMPPGVAGPVWSDLRPGWAGLTASTLGAGPEHPRLSLHSSGAPEALQLAGGRAQPLPVVLRRWLAQFPAASALTLSSVHWALQGTGRDSPLAGGYFAEGSDPTTRAPHVSETQAARYLIRTALMALGSGLVERLYCSALVHPGYGLIDPRAGWRERPAWQALAEWHRRMAGESFGDYRVEAGVHWWRFSRLSVVYALSPCELELPAGCHAVDLYGRACRLQNGVIELDDSPVYLV